MKCKVLSVVLITSLLLGLFNQAEPESVNAGVITKDLHAELGAPAMALSDVKLYKNKKLTGKSSGSIPKGTVVRILNENSIDYNGMVLFFDKSCIVTGDKLTDYVVKHKRRFDKKVTTTRCTKLYSVKTYDEIAIVGPDTSFLITGEDKDFYKVTFDEHKALLYKDDAAEELYVKVTSYNNVSLSFTEVYEQLKRLAASMGMDTSQFDYRTAVSSSVVEYALKFVGNSYVWGGTSLTDGCDCSGFTQQVYKHFGVKLPRCSYEQALVGTSVELDQLQPGDLLFFRRGSKIGHVAIFAGNDMIVHAKGTKYGIVHEPLKETPVVCRRLITEESKSEK